MHFIFSKHFMVFYQSVPVSTSTISSLPPVAESNASVMLHAFFFGVALPEPAYSLSHGWSHFFPLLSLPVILPLHLESKSKQTYYELKEIYLSVGFHSLSVSTCTSPFRMCHR